MRYQTRGTVTRAEQSSQRRASADPAAIQRYRDPTSCLRRLTMALFRSLIVWFAALASVQHVVLATEELTPERFKELTTSGKNGMVKFYQVCYLERR